MTSSASPARLPLLAGVVAGGLVGVVAGRVTAPSPAAPVAAAATSVRAAASSPGAAAGYADGAGRTSGAAPAAAGRKDADDADDARVDTAAPVPTTTTTTTPGVPRPAAAPGSCEAALQEQTEKLATLEKRRKELEGEPLAARTDTAPRFQSAGLVQTFERGFALTGLVGKVESVDCTEHPCILFGRLQGDEEGVATLEDSAPFSAYDEDIGVMLTWASADHGHDGAPKAGLRREKPPEISLFAFAYYTHEDREQHGEMIDRRIRARTAEYWNASAVRE
jgi:hypothetical protein